MRINACYAVKRSLVKNSISCSVDGAIAYTGTKCENVEYFNRLSTDCIETKKDDSLISTVN